MNKIFLILSLLVFSSCSSKIGKKNYGQKITTSSIFKLELGMTKKEVIQLVGEPIPIMDTLKDGWTMTRKVDGNHPMIWLKFNNSNRLEKVLIKYFDYFESYSVYGLVVDSDSIRSWGCRNPKELNPYFKW